MMMRVASTTVLALTLMAGVLYMVGGANVAFAADEPAAHGEESVADDAHGGDAGHGEGHAEATIDPVGWDQAKTDLAIWTAVVFLLLLIILTFAAWKPIMSGLEKREQHIADEIAAAERSNVEAKKLLEQYQQKLTESEDEVRQMIEESKREAEKAGEAIVKQAHSAAEAERHRAMREIESATTVALEELAEKSADLAVGLAEKLVRARIDPAAHADLIKQAVSGLSKEKHGS